MRAEAFAFLPIVRGKNRLEVKNENTSDEAEIILIGAVGKNWWDDSGITEQEVRDALKSIPKDKKINIRVNSEGGSVKEGLGIYNAFKERRDTTTAYITGYALSIASVFPLGAGKVVSPKSAIWMMHKAWAWNQGNADDMRQAADMLDAHDETLVDVYSAETGKTKKDIRAAMDKETWIKGAAAVDFGLADETDTEEDETEASYRPIDPAILARCKNIPAEIYNALSAPRQGAAKPKPNKSQEIIMNRAQMLALLKSWGVEIDDKWTDEEIVALVAKGNKKASPAPPPAPVAAASADDIADIKRQLAKARRDRIQDRIEKYVDAQKITRAEVLIFVSAALEDEAATFKILDEKETQNPGGDAAGAFIGDINDGPLAPPLMANKNGVQGSKIVPELDNLFASTLNVKERSDDGIPLRAIARYEAMKMQWPNLLRAGLRKDNGVQNANTFSATITTNFLILGVTVKLYNRFAAARLFTKDAEQDPYKPLAVGIRKFNTTTTDGTQVQTDPTDFEGLGAGGDSTIDPITVTPHQYVSGGHITNAQLNSGFRIADIVEAKLVDLGAKISQVMTAPITTANFTTNAALVSAPAAFGFSDLADLQGTLKKSLIKNLLLDGEYLARVSNTPGFFQMAGTVGGSMGAWAAFGWDNIALHTEWTGAGASVRGFACNPQAIGTITGLPLNPPEGIPGNIVQIGVAMLPDNQLAIATYAWFSAAARTFFFTYDMIAGAALLDETAGRLVKSA